MTILEEAAKRQKALEIYAEVTGARGGGAPGVTKGPGTLPTAAERAENGQKIANTSAAARAPQAAARDADIRKAGPAGGLPSAEPKKTKPNRRENEFMLNLMVLRNTLRVNAPACRERARTAGKWVWRDMRLMLALVDKVQKAMLRTMPESRDDYYAAYAQHGHYRWYPPESELRKATERYKELFCK